MADLLVNLYSFDDRVDEAGLNSRGINISRVLSPDKQLVIHFVKKHFTDQWAAECEAAFANNPISCFIATHERKIVGFACYDATAKNFFGPTGVQKKYSGKGIGTVLLKRCLTSMKNDGYGYAVIGWAEGAAEFYKKAAGAVIIEGSENYNIYSRLVNSK